MQPEADLSALAAGVEAQVEGDLVVAGPAGVEFGAGGAGQFGDAALDGRMDVFVEGQEDEGWRRADLDRLLRLGTARRDEQGSKQRDRESHGQASGGGSE